jgi:hypothetical protein
MPAAKKSANDNLLNPCREHLDRFFAEYPNPALNTRAAKALRLLAAIGAPLGGKPEAWAAGTIYAVANIDRQPCGVPGVLNSDFTAFFGVSMEAIRRRAAEVVRQISV